MKIRKRTKLPQFYLDDANVKTYGTRTVYVNHQAQHSVRLLPSFVEIIENNFPFLYSTKLNLNFAIKFFKLKFLKSPTVALIPHV